MKPRLIERVKMWICKKFGHNKVFSHHYGQDWYVCKRCGRLLEEGSE